MQKEVSNAQQPNYQRLAARLSATPNNLDLSDTAKYEHRPHPLNKVTEMTGGANPQAKGLRAGALYCRSLNTVKFPVKWWPPATHMYLSKTTTLWSL